MSEELINWDRAEKHLYNMKQGYKEIGPMGIFGLSSIIPLVKRFEDGERTKELYDKIMELE